MRLLNVETMKMEEFLGPVPPYAILSHRWGEDEVTLQEWQRFDVLEDKIFCITRQHAFGRPRFPNDYLHDSLQQKWRKFSTEKGTITSKSGYSKILSCCKLVREQRISVEKQDHPCRYVWIDTCCIDKTNNAELSEAINSMFHWYKNSLVCFVHLVDVRANLGQKKMEGEVRKSGWFRRGWTLQELLAPSIIMFLDQEWGFIFYREHQPRLISSITRIDEEILTGSKSLSAACSAEKMSWAASRTTTRKEDIAYCLLGIFDVNMPLLYGEGDKAFMRLQEEIIRQSGDLSIFAWGYNVPKVYETSGIFAQSPADFIGCSKFHRGHNRLAVMSMMNVTLSVQLRYYNPGTTALDFIYADLDCYSGGGRSIFLPLVLETPEDSDHKSNSTPFAADITNLRFERRSGSRPIVLSDSSFNWGWRSDHGWVEESGSISILKKDSERHFPRPSRIHLRGLNIAASQHITDEASSKGAMDQPLLRVVVDEVYPPHFSGKNARTIDMLVIEAIDRPTILYPVSYLRISCWDDNSKISEMLVIVRCSETWDSTSTHWKTDLGVRLSEWPQFGCRSLADCAFRGHTQERNTGTTPILGPGVEGKEFGDFIVHHDGNAIYFLAPREGNGKPGEATEGSKDSVEDLMAEEFKDLYVEEVGSEWSVDSGDLGVHGLFDRSSTKVTGPPSGNATVISQPNENDYDTRDAENDVGGIQVYEESDSKNEDNDYLGITGLFQ